jgi:hypothetical protein
MMIAGACIVPLLVLFFTNFLVVRTAPAQPAAPRNQPVSEETTAPPASPQHDAYLKAVDSLTDEQTEMVPVVLATVGELACDGLELDRKKTAAFIAAHASDESQQARQDAAQTAKSTTDVLLGPWLAFVHQDSDAFCTHAYALKQSGQDLWKN